MMKKRNKIISLFLALVLFTAGFPCGAGRAYAGNAGTAQQFFDLGGRIPHVDYTRIPILTAQGSDLKIPVNVTVGEVSFKTYLMFGKELSQKEQDAIIKGCMFDCELTSDKIREGNELIKKVKTQTGFDPKIIAKIIFNALLGLYPDAVGNTVAIEQGFYDVAEGNVSESEMRADFVIGNTVSTLVGMGLEGVAGYAVKVLAASGKDIAKEAIRLLREREDARNALEYEVLFTKFYEECNDKIIAAMTGERGWHITGKGKVPQKITAFGSPVTQTWYLDMDLEKTTSGANPLDWTGSYDGYIHLKIEHDTRVMDQEFPDQVFKQYGMFKTIWDTGMYSFYDKSDLPSEMWKRLRKNDVHVLLNASGRKDGMPVTSGKHEQIAQIFLSGFEDQSRFWSIRKIRINPKILENALGENQEGEWQNIAAKGAATNLVYVTGDMSDDYSYPVYKYIKNDMDANLFARGYTWVQDLDQQGFTDIGKDTEVYRNLKSGIIEITYGWKGWD